MARGFPALYLMLTFFTLNTEIRRIILQNPNWVFRTHNEMPNAYNPLTASENDPPGYYLILIYGKPARKR